MAAREYIDILLECNGRRMRLGMSASGERREWGITKVEGLESPKAELSRSENAMEDGCTVTGKRVRERTVHLEATLRGMGDRALRRQEAIRLFSPKHTGMLTVDHSGTVRRAAYELEGWAFAAADSVRGDLSIVADLLCPDPFFRRTDDFGRNMAEVSRQIAFPWRVLGAGAQVPAPYGALGLPGKVAGYRSLTRKVRLPNDGDVPTPWRAHFTAERGPCECPRIDLDGTGRFVRVCVSMRKGDVLVVDTDRRRQRVELNGVNVYHKIDRRSDPFELAVGDNWLTYDADDGYSNLDVWLYYTPKYLGV